jgi:Xaa-Pro aminopeptidase
MDRLARKMAQDKLDAFIEMTEINRYYLTGFHSSAGILVLSRSSDPVLFTDFRYLEMARRQMKNATVRDIKLKPKLRDMLRPLALKGNWKTIGYEGSISSVSFKNLAKSLPDEKALTDSEKSIRELRAIKSPREQAAMRCSARSNDALLSHVLDEITPGMSEWSIRGVIRKWTDILGQGESFPSIVCVGSNASQCHHNPAHRVLRAGQELLLDLGVTVNDYLSDMTRTVFFGKPSKTLRKIHKIVLEANRRAVNAVRAGKTCKQIDAVARGVIKRAGYGKNFGHGLGHGVGLEIHEFPSFGPKDKTVLKPGMIMTIEPGIYLPGIGGVRIEDMILVKKNGCEVLTSSPRTLIIE